jgi:alpha-1,6-mannosyltransferase
LNLSPRQRRAAVVGALLTIFALAACGRYGRHNSDIAFYASVFGQALVAGAIAWLISRGDKDPALVLLALAAALALRLWFLIEPPLLSGDIYRYIWDGRVINAGFNPYVHIPADPLLTPLRDPSQYGLIDKRDYAVTIYPPVAEGIFALVTRFSTSVLGMRLAMIGFEVIAVAATLRMMRSLSRPPGLIVLYVLHPAGIWEIANNGHVEAAMMALVFGGFAWGLTARSRLGAAALATLGTLVKPTGALALPAIWRPMDLRMPALCAAIALACYAPFLSAGAGVIGFLPNYVHEQGLDDGKGIFLLAVARRLGAYAPWMSGAYVAIASLIVMGLGLKVGFSRDVSLQGALRGTAILMIAFLVLLSPTLPWYFLPVALFAPLLGLWSPVVMTTTGFLLYSFQSDSISFFARWSLSMALIAPALVRDFRVLSQKPAAQ